MLYTTKFVFIIYPYAMMCVDFFYIECYNGQTRLVNNYTTLDGIYIYINGTVEVCVDGQYVPICGDIASDIATRACHSILYYG